MFENTDAILGLAFNLFVIIVGVALFLIIGGAIVYFYWYKNKRYKQYSINVLERDGFGNIKGYKDDGAVFSVGNNKRLWTRVSNISLPGDNIPYIDIGGRKEVYLLKKGTKNYMYVLPKVNDNGIEFNVGEEDLNWALINFDQSTKSFGQNWLMQYAPFMLGAFSLLIVLVVVVLLTKKIDDIVEIVRMLKEPLGAVISSSVV